MDTKIKIVHLEDLPSDAALVELVLKRGGLKFEKLVADSKEKYIQALEAFAPDIILADHSLPSFNSDEALELVKAANLRIPFILITAAMSDEFAVNILKNGADDYIIKDRLERLPAAILNALEKNRLEKERQLILNSLISNEYKFRGLIENGADVVGIFNADFVPTYISPSIRRVLGYTEKEVRLLPLTDLVHPDDLETALLKIAACKAKPGIPVKGLQSRIRHKDGSWRWIESTLTNMLHDPVINGIIDNFRDITNKRAAEEKLKKSEEKYKLLFQNNPLPNWIYDLNTARILDVNEAAISHYGYSRQEFLQMTIGDLWPAGKVSELASFKTESEPEPTIEQFGTFNHLKKDKTPIKVKASGYRLNYNQTDCMLVVCNDITEIEATLQKLQDRETKLVRAQHMARLGYWEFNLHNNTIYWSDEVFNIWGRTREGFPVTPASFMDTLHPDDKAYFLKEQKAASSGQKDLDIEYRVILPDGSVRWVHDKGKLVTKEQGQPVVFEGMAQDITDRKMALERLMLSEARHRGIVQSQTNYIIRIDLTGNYTYCNEKFLKDFSWIYPEGNALGQNSMLSIREYHHPRVIEAGTLCVTHPNTNIQVELDKPLADGSTKTTIWDFVCLTNAFGEPSEMQCVGIDITDRVKAERSLKESNQRYELVSKATSDAIWDWDLETDTVFWGEGFQTIFGYPPQTFIPYINTWLNNIHPADYYRIKQGIEAFLQQPESNNWKEEYRFKKADGKYAYVIDRGFVIRDDTNKAIRMVGAMQDITENKRLEDLLNKAGTLARIGSYEADLVNRKVYWSDMTKEIHEVESMYLPTLESALNFYEAGINRDTIYNAYRLAVEQNIPFDLELQLITAKGNKRWIRAIGETEVKDGVCVRIYGSLQDIDKVKRAELNVIKAFEEKNIILESIGDAFFALDQNWTVTYWNKKAAQLLSTPKSKIVGKNLWDVFPNLVASAFYTYYNKAITKNKIQHFETYYESANSWLDVTAYPSQAGLSIFLRDITERKKSELKLLQLNESLKAYTDELVTANKGLEQFSYIVSHNLRAPVANILGLADLMNQDGYSPEIRAAFSQGLLTNTKRLDDVIQDLNAILQVKKGITEQKKIVYLNELVADIEASVQHLMVREKVKISTDFKGFDRLHTIKSYLHSIFFNLITNSIKYSHPNRRPEINITASRQGEKLFLLFKDNGLGIDLNKKGDQVFGLYKRFHNTVEGKGMGLFMVKTQVEALGGKISVQSEVNKGTEFLIEFENNDSNQIFIDESKAAPVYSC